MVTRYVFKKWNNTPDLAECWHCNQKTLFFIYDKKTGEDFFCCLECAYKKYKIKRLKSLLKKYPIRKKKAILEQNPLIKKSENVCIEVVSGVKEGGI